MTRPRQYPGPHPASKEGTAGLRIRLAAKRQVRSLPLVQVRWMKEEK